MPCNEAGHPDYPAGVYCLGRCGLNVYNASAVLSFEPTFQVVRIDATSMTVATWNWKENKWAWTHTTPIRSGQ